MGPVCPVTHRRRWIGPLVVLLLIFIVPGCWAGALAGTLETETAPLSSTTDEESKKYELEDEIPIVRTRVRPPSPPSAAAVATIPRQKPVTHRTSTLLASVAPKSHPSRFSVRRLQ